MNTNKTLGQIACEAWHPKDGSDPWKTSQFQNSWERAAAAVIAHHKAQKKPQPKFKVGDRIRKIGMDCSWAPIGFETVVLPSAGFQYKDKDGEIVQLVDEYWEKVEWTLPAPPACRSWHRNDWTADMLPDGWRPLLMGESLQKNDAGNFGDGFVEFQGGNATPYVHYHYRTRRPLPSAHECKITLPPLRLTHGINSYAHTTP